MAGCVEVPGGVPVLRLVTAPDVAADQADTQVHPRIAHLEALLAALGAGCNLLDLLQMCAVGGQRPPFSEQPFECIAAYAHALCFSSPNKTKRVKENMNVCSIPALAPRPR